MGHAFVLNIFEQHARVGGVGCTQDARQSARLLPARTQRQTTGLLSCTRTHTHTHIPHPTPLSLCLFLSFTHARALSLFGSGGCGRGADHRTFTPLKLHTALSPFAECQSHHTTKREQQSPPSQCDWPLYHVCADWTECSAAGKRLLNSTQRPHAKLVVPRPCYYCSQTTAMAGSGASK